MDFTNVIVYFLFIIFLICLSIMWIIKTCAIPSKVIKEYGIPNTSFWTSRYTFAARLSDINPTFIALYDTFIVIQGLSDKWVIDKNNYVEFKQKSYGILYPYTLKFCLVNKNYYKCEEIRFAMLSNKKVKLM